jgi:hypothetical protein
MAQSMAPMLQTGGTPNLLGQWSAAFPMFGFVKPEEAAAAAATAMQTMFAPWAALMAGAAGTGAALPAGLTPPEHGTAPAPILRWPAMSQPWVDIAGQLAGATPAQLGTAFDRTYGALSDALGMSPMRKLNAAWQELIAASIAQQEARAKYALLVQSAFAQGLQRLMTRLAEMANSGERIDSVLALLRLWAAKAEEAVHETLQSDAGLAATAALTRSGLAYRKKMQQVAAIIGEMLDMATRRELDEAYREIQALKRELRASRAVHAKSGGATEYGAAD